MAAVQRLTVAPQTPIFAMLMPDPLVSCIVAVFNGERFLRAALESILAQTYPRTEIIVVDDGSTDGSSAVAAACDPRVLCLRQDNAGPAAGRNTGIGAARGEIVAFLDADDLWVADKLERQVRRFIEKADLEVTYGLAENFWDAEVAAVEDRFKDHRISRPFPAPGVTMAVRRHVFERIGLFDVAMGHAFVPNWLILAREHGVVIELAHDVLTRRRVHSGNRSRQLADRSREEFLHLMKQHLDRRRREGQKPQ